MTSLALPKDRGGRYCALMLLCCAMEAGGAPGAPCARRTLERVRRGAGGSARDHECAVKLRRGGLRGGGCAFRDEDLEAAETSGEHWRTLAGARCRAPGCRARGNGRTD